MSNHQGHKEKKGTVSKIYNSFVAWTELETV